jgi:hypothetical protein
MKRVPLLILALTLCVVALSWKPAEAALVCSSTYRNTSTYFGTGTSCSQAQNNLYNKAVAGVGCGNYSSCYETLVITTSCRFTSGSYRVDGYIRYRCYICTSPPCPF